MSTTKEQLQELAERRQRLEWAVAAEMAAKFTSESANEFAFSIRNLFQFAETDVQLEALGHLAVTAAETIRRTRAVLNEKSNARTTAQRLYEDWKRGVDAQETKAKDPDAPPCAEGCALPPMHRGGCGAPEPERF